MEFIFNEDGFSYHYSARPKFHRKANIVYNWDDNTLALTCKENSSTYKKWFNITNEK